jgi:hypothetical protein
VKLSGEWESVTKQMWVSLVVMMIEGIQVWEGRRGRRGGILVVVVVVDERREVLKLNGGGCLFVWCHGPVPGGTGEIVFVVLDTDRP